LEQKGRIDRVQTIKHQRFRIRSRTGEASVGLSFLLLTILATV
jgi:hypothetical protein